jgi:VanZ family protein
LLGLNGLLKRWGPALAVMALIFLASSQPKAVLPDYGDEDWLVKKTGHVVIYAGLAWTYLWGLTGGQGLTWRNAALAVSLAALYGASDELHQSFVAGRGATVLDVGIDTVGAALGALLWTTWQRWRARTLKQNLRGS